jgi:hypothetical protein
LPKFKLSCTDAGDDTTVDEQIGACDKTGMLTQQWFRKKMQEKQEEFEIMHFSHLYFVNLPQNKQLSLK